VGCYVSMVVLLVVGIVGLGVVSRGGVGVEWFCGCAFGGGRWVREGGMSVVELVLGGRGFGCC